MILDIDGDINRYYAQTLCMIYFPGADFSNKNDISEHQSAVSFKIAENGDGAYVSVCIRTGEEEAAADSLITYKPEYTKDKCVKIAAGAAMIKAGKKLFGCTPPWGILTGVRPSKIVADLFQKGLKTSEIKNILINEYYINPKKATLVTNIASREEKIIKKLPKNSCSVYISIPFCPTRCAYCSFVSYSTKRLLSLIPEYLEQLYIDIDDILSLIKSLGQKITTVYIGGGTPTILNEIQLETLLKRIAAHIDVSSLLEYTIEAGRPDTINKEKINIAMQYGVNRISINPQTLNDEVLTRIGRKHTSEEFFKAFGAARECGIKYINTDLIAGLPGEGYRSFSSSIDEIIKLKPENIMVHTFCVKKSADIIKNNTDLYSINGGETGKSVDYSQIMTKNAGYVPYYMYRQKNTIGNFENVGFSLEGMEGKYNIFIMEEIHSIFAAGAGSVTKLISPDRKQIQRFFMPKYPYEYLNLKNKPEIKRNIYEKINLFYNP